MFIDNPCVFKVFDNKFQADRAIATTTGGGQLSCTNYDACVLFRSGAAAC